MACLSWSMAAAWPGAADDELLVDLLDEGDELVIAAERGLGIGTHTGNSGGCVKVGGAGTLGRCHDLALQLFDGPAVINRYTYAGVCICQLVCKLAVVHIKPYVYAGIGQLRHWFLLVHDKIQARFGACQFVREADYLFDGSQTAHSGDEALESAQKSIRRRRTAPDGAVQLVLGVVCIPYLLLSAGKIRHDSGKFCPGLPDAGNINGPAGSSIQRFEAVHHDVHRPVHGAQRAGDAVIKGDRCPNGRQTASPPFALSFGFFLPFLFFLSAYFAGGDDKGSLFPGQGEKGGGNEVQFLQAIVGDVCLLIALSYQFFASSTSSCRGTSKPQTSCTFCRYSAYSPEVSMVLSRFSAPMTL